MDNFLYGIAIMYLLAIPLLWFIAEDEETGGTPYMFGFMWPLVALEVIVRILIGDKSDGTGTD